MRYLHPVGAHEVFVGSGTYITRRDGKPFGPPEHWTIHELPDGAWFIRMDRDGREVDGRSELIEAWRSPAREGGRVERFDVAASNRPDDMPRRLQMTVEIVGEQVSVGRSLDGGERQAEVLALEPVTWMQPGAYVFVGALLAGEAGRVLWRYGLDGAYRTEIADVRTTVGAVTQVDISGREREVREYQGDWLLGPGGAVVGDVRYWVDTNGMLVRCVAGPLVVTLERYAFRR